VPGANLLNVLPEGGLKKSMSEIYWSQRSLTPLLHVLEKSYNGGPNYARMYADYCRTHYNVIADQDEEEMSLFGVSPEEVHTLHLEGWGHIDDHQVDELFTPDKLITLEMARRGLASSAWIDHAVLFGYTNKDTLEPVEAYTLKDPVVAECLGLKCLAEKEIGGNEKLVWRKARRGDGLRYKWYHVQCEEKESDSVGDILDALDDFNAGFVNDYYAQDVPDDMDMAE
jgi:hypothetical protein